MASGMSGKLQELLEINLKYHDDRETDTCLNLTCIHSRADDTVTIVQQTRSPAYSVDFYWQCFIS